MYFVPPANAADRLAQELVVDSTIEFAMQDVNTIEATHSALKTRAQNTFHLSDQELLIRQFHTVIRDTVAASPGRGDMMTESVLPAGFAELEPFVADWALPTRAQRYEARLSKPYDELVSVLRRRRAASRGGDRLPEWARNRRIAGRRDQAAAPAVFDDPGLLRRQRVQAEPHPGLRRGLLRHGRRTGGVIGPHDDRIRAT